MSGLGPPHDPFLFMKVGKHAREELDEVCEREHRELRESGAGVMFWGYGGPTCHPRLVQSFAHGRSGALHGPHGAPEPVSRGYEMTGA